MLGLSMTITLMLPSFVFRSGEWSWVGLDKSLSNGRVFGFSYEDPTVGGNGKPLTVILNKDPKTGEPIDPPIRGYVYIPGTPFTSGVNHPDNLGPTVKRLSLVKGKIDQANRNSGAVFTIERAEVNCQEWPYVVNESVNLCWTTEIVL